MRATASAVCLGVMLGQFGLCVAVLHSVGVGSARADSTPAKPDAVAVGYEIFNREWMPNDPRAHGGDGLGPVFNDSSCVACHNSGGSGGAGPVGKNIDILSASRNGGMPVPTPVSASTAGQAQCAPNAPVDSAALAPLLEVHAGFRTGRTVVLHKFGVDPNYDSWRSRALNPAARQNPDAAIGITVVSTTVSPFAVEVEQSVQAGLPMRNEVGFAPNARNTRSAAESAEQRAATRLQQVRMSVLASNPAMSQQTAVGAFVVSRSQRNPTPLFGLGLIDAIPDAAIEAMVKQQARESRETQGRVSRLKDGRVGRLGWKGQTANTEEFVLNACAVELGLEVPGHHQALTPQAPKYEASGLDLTSEECSSLVAYVRSLPRPLERRPSSVEEAKHLEGGRAAFASIGCAGCHAPKVGNVVGIFSDLLLHDMGQELADDGSYDGSDDGTDEPLIPRKTSDLAASQPVRPGAAQPPRGATRREWRTPPLWGFRDSGPYLHDGRAQTLEQAVAMHGGQGQASALKFFQLSPRERLQVESFLKSLVAPPAVQLAHRGE